MKMIILFLFFLLIHAHGLTELIIILGNNNPNIQNKRIQKAIEYLNNDSLNKRIKNSEKDKNPLICIVGDKDVEENSVKIRDKLKKENYTSYFNSFIG